VRIAALYDIHGNLPALEAVLDDVRRAGVDLIVIGGDVLPGPMPRETTDCLLSLDIPTRCLHGNGDREVLAARRGAETQTLPAQALEAIRWTAGELAPEQAEALARWPDTLTIAIPGLGDVLFCHASPRNDVDIFTRATAEDRLLPLFAEVEAPLVVCGHTHMPFDRAVGRTRVVNAGSVGMPFGEPGAYWLLLAPDVEPRRTTYDLGAAADRIRSTSYPRAHEFADGYLLRPPSESAMLAVYASAEVSREGR